MPRYDLPPVTVAPAPVKRSYARPWSIEEAIGAFVVRDANDVELFRLQYTPEEQRKRFPTGMTYAEAEALVEWMVPVLEERAEIDEP